MDWKIVWPVVGLAATMVAGFGATMRAIGRLEQKFDLVWDWYCDERRPAGAGGRRAYDPRIPWEAHDHPASLAEHDRDG